MMPKLREVGSASRRIEKILSKFVPLTRLASQTKVRPIACYSDIASFEETKNRKLLNKSIDLLVMFFLNLV